MRGANYWIQRGGGASLKFRDRRSMAFLNFDLATASSFFFCPAVMGGNMINH